MVLWVLAAGLALSGCAGGDYVLKEYLHTVPVNFEVPGEDIYRMFDKPEAGKVMITPSLAKAALMGAGQGITWGSADTSIPKPVYEAAVRGYLDSTGRQACRIVDGYKLIHPQWEFKYDCSAPPAPPPVAQRRR